MPDWPHDDLKSKKAFFGDPSKRGFLNNNMILIIPPFQTYYDGNHLRGWNVNKKVAASLLRVLNEVFEKCEHDQKKIDEIGISSFSGCYNYRPIRGTTNLSNHAFGAAIDLDAEHNPLGSKKNNWPSFVIDAFKKENWLWGGDYKGRKDPMHFEAVSR